MDMELPKSRDRLAGVVHARLRAAALWRSQNRVDKCESVETWQARCDRAYRREHEPSELKVYPDMSGYMPVSKFKVDGTLAAITDLLAPVIMRPFAVTPTPEPELNQDSIQVVRDAVARELQQLLASKGLSLLDVMSSDGVVYDEAEQWIRARTRAVAQAERDLQRNLAARSVSKIETAMADMLAESAWRSEFSRFLRNGLKDMAAFIRGPEFVRKPQAVWRGNAYTRTYKMVPEFRTIEFWNAYPAPDASSAADGEGFTETEWVTVEQLATLMDVRGYDKSALRELIENHPKADYGWVPDKAMTFPSLFGNKGRETTKPTGIMRIRHQGRFTGAELANLGVDSVGMTEMVDLEIEVIGGRVVKVGEVPAPSGMRNVYSTSFREDAGVYGSPIPFMLYDAQIRINRLHYLAIKAAMQQAGAHYLYDPNAMVNGDRPTLLPFTGSVVNMRAVPGTVPVMTQQPQPTFGALWAQMLAEIKLTDEITGVSVLNYAAPQSNPALRTATGMSMLYAAASKQVKNFLANIDSNVMPHLLGNAYRILIETRPDLRIGADARIGSSGLSSLIEREVQQARLAETIQFLTNGAAAGVVPKPILDGAWRLFLESLGLKAEVDQYMPEGGIEQAIRDAIVRSEPQTQVNVAPQTPVAPEMLPNEVTMGARDAVAPL